jgi:hypothetical protein
MKAKHLKELCKELGLKLSGKKSELQDRIREHYQSSAADIVESKSEQNGLESMSAEDLRDTAIARGLPGAGTKEQLIERLSEDIKAIKELESAMSPSSNEGYVALSKVLEEAAAKKDGALAEYLAEMKEKSMQLPKYTDVTVTSLSLIPEKYTSGGAPSVTSDVLRGLAGDPFSDEPRYGSVSRSIADLTTLMPLLDMSNAFILR